MSEKIKQYFVQKEVYKYSKEKLESLISKLTATEIGTSLLESFMRSGGAIVINNVECEKREALGLYWPDTNLIIIRDDAPATTVCHELAHARQYKLIPNLRNMHFPSISLTSEAHLSVLKEADAWAICAIFWKQAIREFPLGAGFFIEEEMKDLGKLEDIFFEGEDPEITKRLQPHMKNKETKYNVGFAKLALAAASISSMAIESLERGNFGKTVLEISADHPDYDVFTEILPQETDMSYAANLFQEYVIGENREHTVASHYIEMTLDRRGDKRLELESRYLSNEFANFANIESVQRAIPEITEEAFETIIKIFGSLEDLGIGRYTECLHESLAKPQPSLFRKAEPIEWQIIERSF